MVILATTWQFAFPEAIESCYFEWQVVDANDMPNIAYTKIEKLLTLVIAPMLEWNEYVASIGKYWK